jgi:hypothetical protein
LKSAASLRNLVIDPQRLQDDLMETARVGYRATADMISGA